MRIDASRWGCAKNKCHARPTANKFGRLWNICNGIFSFHFFDEDPKAFHFDETLLREMFSQMLAEQHIRCFPTTENDVVKCKSKSIWMDLYCIVVNHGFQKMLLLRTNKWLNAARVGNDFINCANVSLERSLRIKLLNRIAWVVHLTYKIFSFRIDSVES